MLGILFVLSLPLAVGLLVAAAVRPTRRTLLASAIAIAAVPVSFLLPWLLASLLD
jgi:hypothetical protein